jgi:hypothetical protein
LDRARHAGAFVFEVTRTQELRALCGKWLDASAPMRVMAFGAVGARAQRSATASTDAAPRTYTTEKSPLYTLRSFATAALLVALPSSTFAQASAAEPPKAEAAAPAPAAPSAPAPAPDVKITWYGQLHTAAFASTDRFVTASGASSNLNPAFAAGGRGAFALSANATRLGLRVGLPTVLGATGTAQLEVDFRGGTTTSNFSAFGNPVLRYRIAFGQLLWNTSFGSIGVGAGQDFGLVAPLTPVTSAYLPDQVFASAGNAWRRHPQARVFGNAALSESVGLTFAAAALPPADVGATSAAEGVDSGAGVRSRQPDLEGRVAVKMSRDKKSLLEVGVGYGHGTERFENAGSAEDLNKKILAVDGQLDLGLVAARGEWFMGENADVYSANIGGAARGTAAGATFDPKGNQTTGFWGQLVVKPIAEVQLTAGYGQETPDEDDLDESGYTATAPTRFSKNAMVMAGVIWTPAKAFRVGLEWRRTTTTYRSATEETDREADQTALSTAFVF